MYWIHVCFGATLTKIVDPFLVVFMPSGHRVWFGLGFQIYLEITCLGMIYHIQKDSWSLDDQNQPPRKIMDFYNFSLVGEASDPVRKGPPLWNSGISKMFYFFGKMRWFYRVKSVLPFSKLIVGKSQFFSSPRTCICTDLRKYVPRGGGHIVSRVCV